jgi:hypothetical protein
MVARQGTRSRRGGRAPLRLGDRVQLRVAFLVIQATVIEERGYRDGRQAVAITWVDQADQTQKLDCFADELTIVRRFRPSSRIA